MAFLNVIRAAALVSLLIGASYVSAYDAASFTRDLASYDIASDYSNAFALIASRIAADNTYDGYADTRRFITGEAQARTAESVFASRIRTEKIDAGHAVIRRLFRTLFFALTDAGHTDTACIAAERYAKHPAFDAAVIAAKITPFFQLGKYDEYMRLFALIGEKERSAEYVRAAKAAMRLGSNALALEYYQRVYSNAAPAAEAFSLGVLSLRVKEYKSALSYFSAVTDRASAAPVWYYEDITRLMLGMPSSAERSAYGPYCAAVRYFLAGNYSNAAEQYERSLTQPLPAAWHAQTLLMIDILSDRSMDDAALRLYSPYLTALAAEDEKAQASALLAFVSSDAPERIRIMSAVNGNASPGLRAALLRMTPKAAAAKQAVLFLTARIDMLLGNAKAARDGFTAYLIDAPDGLFAHEARTALTGLPVKATP